MNEATLEIEKSDEGATGVEKSPPEAIPVHKKQIAPWKWLAIAVIAIGLVVGMWFLLSRRSRAAARQQPVSQSETSARGHRSRSSTDAHSARRCDCAGEDRLQR